MEHYERALKTLEYDKILAKSAPEPVQPSLDEVLNAAVADELKRLDPNSLTPIEALNKLSELKKILAPLS